MSHDSPGARGPRIITWREAKRYLKGEDGKISISDPRNTQALQMQEVIRKIRSVMDALRIRQPKIEILNSTLMQLRDYLKKLEAEHGRTLGRGTQGRSTCDKTQQNLF